MAYIGSTPTSQNFISGTDYFNGTGSQTAFTLTRTVNSVNDVEVVVNNVVQQPNSYTVSGTTLTLSAAPSSGTNNVYARYLSTTIQTIAPSQGTVTTPTIADAAVTQAKLGSGVAGTGPAFSAYANAAQTVSSNVFTKVVLQVEDFDTNNNFDNTTNYRFTPTVAGYYQINANLRLNGTGTTVQLSFQIYKNGSSFTGLVDINPSASLATSGIAQIGNSTIIYMNGSTDYLEIYGYYYLGTSTFSANTPYTSRFSGSLVRAA